MLEGGEGCFQGKHEPPMNTAVSSKKMFALINTRIILKIACCAHGLVELCVNSIDLTVM